MKKKKVIVAISGGVDSSISAWILKKKYNVEGLFMKNWQENKTNENCKSNIDLYYAKKICNKLKIILHTVNFSKEYWNNVFRIFLLGLKKGITLNPDIICNKKIKFKFFLNYAFKKFKAKYISTGHYVSYKKIRNKIFLIKSKDKKKDQSYFLYSLKKKQILKTIFPIGNFKKKKIRKIAKKLNLITAKRKDSYGICFIGKKKFRKFLKKYLKKKKGNIITRSGKIIGTHSGVIFYTIGQRKGLNIKKNKIYKKTWYIYKKDLIKNNLIVVKGKKNKKLTSWNFKINKINLINKMKFKKLYCGIKTRYQQKDITCLIKIYKKKIKIKLINKFSYSITKGQSAVIYYGDICLGGGTIY